MLGMENWNGTEVTKSAKNEILARSGFPDHDPWVFLQVDKLPLYVAIYFYNFTYCSAPPYDQPH